MKIIYAFHNIIYKIHGDLLKQSNKLIDNILINNLGMSKQSGLIIGSIIFLFLGIVAAIAFHVYVGMKSPSSTKKANQQVSLVSVIIATISMWIMWACTYMHQMNPLIQPILMVKAQ